MQSLIIVTFRGWRGDFCRKKFKITNKSCIFKFTKTGTFCPSAIFLFSRMLVFGSQIF